MAEGQVLLDAIDVRRIYARRAAEAAAASGAFGLAQVAPAGAGVRDLAPSRDLETLGHRLLGLDAFWTSHKSSNLLSKRARNIGSTFPGGKR